MSKLEKYSICAKNFMSYGEHEACFEKIKKINVLIGKNNCGKSAMIEIIHLLCGQKKVSISKRHFHGGKTSQLLIKRKIDEDEIRSSNIYNHFSSYPSRLQEILEVLNGAQAIGEYSNGVLQGLTIPAFSEFQDSALRRFAVGSAFGLINPMENSFFFRLLADRNLKSEPGNKVPLESNGNGFTSLVKQVFTHSDHNHLQFKHKLLVQLNKIFIQEETFTDIEVKEVGNNNWEIFLTQAHKGVISLRDSGSGLKTIILIIVIFELVPYQNSKTLEDCIFAFEELENNLHPALLRRLLSYVEKKAIQKDGCHIFLTTHSNVVIDYFSRNADAQIIHVIQEKKSSRSLTVSSFQEHKHILDDLDVRASDLLQTNCIVWVEGPSDRIYFNRWIELWTDGKLQEGIHYKCLWYGGSLLAHLSADNPDEDPEDFVQILRINTNAIIIIDSDRKSDKDELKLHAKRIQGEISEGYVWITKGKEVENYLPLEALVAYRPELSRQINQFENIKEYLDLPSFDKRKTELAHRWAPYIQRADAEHILDLNDQMNEVIKRIAEWNPSVDL